MAVISTFTVGQAPRYVHITSDWADITADSIDLSWTGFDNMRAEQIGVQMATGVVGTPGTFGVATSGNFDITAGMFQGAEIDTVLESFPSINANTPVVVRRSGQAIRRLVCTRNTIVAGSMTQFRLVSTLYPI